MHVCTIADYGALGLSERGQTDMPLYEIDSSEELVPFRQLVGGAQLYESEIESLLWANIEDFTGESLLPVARQPNVEAGGRPDIVALDENANVVVIEIKRDVDRGQLAQCLEYAGWARTAKLDDVARMYHRGAEAFFGDWQDFTESAVPEVLSRAPRLMLVARDLQGRTESALEFLLENGLPVTVIRVSVYEDSEGRRFLDVEGEHEPDLPASASSESRERIEHKIAGRRVRVSDLLDAGLVESGDELIWERPRLGDTYRAAITDNGAIRLSDGRAFSSPSRAAVEAANIAAYDGWYAWRVPRRGDVLLKDLRAQLIDSSTASD